MHPTRWGVLYLGVAAVLGVLAVVPAVVPPGATSPGALILLYPATTYALLGVVYVMQWYKWGVALLNKNRLTGSIPLPNLILFLPWLLPLWAVWLVRHKYFWRPRKGLLTALASTCCWAATHSGCCRGPSSPSQ